MIWAENVINSFYYETNLCRVFNSCSAKSWQSCLRSGRMLKIPLITNIALRPTSVWLWEPVEKENNINITQQFFQVLFSIINGSRLFVLYSIIFTSGKLTIVVRGVALFRKACAGVYFANWWFGGFNGIQYLHFLTHFI